MDDEFINPNDLYGEGESSPPRATPTDDSPPKDGLHRAVGYLVAAAVLVLVAYFFINGRFGSGRVERTSQGETSQPEIIPTATAKTLESEKPGGSGIVSDKFKEITGLNIPSVGKIDWESEEEISANRSAVAHFKEKLDQILSLSNSNSEGLVLLQSKAEELRTSESGAKIASDDKYVQQYVALREKIAELTVSVPVADDFAGDMRALLKRVEAAGDTSYSPKEFVVARAEELLNQLENKANELRRYDNSIDGLVADTDQLEAGSLLESAIQSQLKIADEELAEYLANARAEANELAKVQLAEAEKERIGSEAALKLAETQTKTNENLEKRKVLLAEAEKQKLEQEFNRDLNSINAYLLPFISEGRNLRGSAEGTGPASFSAIKTMGALENTAGGLAGLARAARNGRQLANFPVNVSADMITFNTTAGHTFNRPQYRAIEAHLEKAQSLLNKYGLLMVEKGMLAE